MLFSYFSVSRADELRIRKRKTERDRVTKRTLKIHADYRVKRFEEVMSVEHIVKGLLRDCVDAVTEMLNDEGKFEENKYEEKKAELVEEKSVVKVEPKKVSLKRRRP